MKQTECDRLWQKGMGKRGRSKGVVNEDWRAARLFGEPWIKINPSSVSCRTILPPLYVPARWMVEDRHRLKVLSRHPVENYLTARYRRWFATWKCSARVAPLVKQCLRVLRDYYPLSTFENSSNFLLACRSLHFASRANFTVTPGNEISLAIIQEKPGRAFEMQRFFGNWKTVTILTIDVHL